MPAHAKEVDRREKYGLWIVWAMVVMVGIVSLMLVFTVTAFLNFWVGTLLGIFTALCMIRLVIYTRDLIKATA